jgi:hypothetical protein
MNDSTMKTKLAFDVTSNFLKSVFQAVSQRSVLVALLLSCFGIFNSVVAAPPNIVLFLIDDLGWCDPGCQGQASNSTTLPMTSAKPGTSSASKRHE